MINMPDWPFNQIAIDLVTDLKAFMSGNQDILTIIDHLTGWPEAFPIPSKKVDTIVHVFINNFLPVHMCPRYILSDKEQNSKINYWTMYSNNLASIIFSLPYTNKMQWKTGGIPQIPKIHTQETVWEWVGQLGRIHQPGTCQLLHNSTPHHRWNTLLSHLWERPQSSPLSTARTHVAISWQPRFWMTNFGNAPSCTSHSQENIGWQ